MIYKRLIFILLLVVFPVSFLIVGCAKTPPGTSDLTNQTSENVGVMFQQAEGYYRNRFYEKALDKYLRIIEVAPKSEYAPPSLYKAGGIQIKQNQFDKAILTFDRLAAEYPRSQYAIEAFYNKGYCFLKLGDTQRAIAALEDYLVRADARHVPRARIYLAEAKAAVGQYDKTLVNLAAASCEKSQNDKQVEILSEAKRLIDHHGDFDVLTSAAKQSASSHVSDYIHYRIALLEHSQERNRKAVEQLEKIDFNRARFSFYREADKLLAQLQDRKPSQKLVVPSQTTPLYTVGVVLPLSGRFSVFGEQVLHGVMLGVNFFGSTDSGAPLIEVIVKDSQSDPDATVEAVRELAANPKVLAIIGPLSKKTSVPAASEAQAIGIPIITMTTQEGICDTGDMVFRNSMTFSLQVKALIRYAHNQKGCRHFAILYPNTKLGEFYTKLFSQFIDPYKNDITASVSYDVDITDFRNQIRQIRAHGQFDALFIPDEADRIAMIAPQLVYFGVKGKVLLGTPSWNQNILAKKAKGYLDDTVIVDAFHVGSSKPTVRAFVEQYKEDFKENPTQLSGFGYDNIAMLAYIFKRGFADSRSSVKTGLLGIRDFEGVTSETTILENGDVSKDLTLLRVGENEIEELF